LLRAGYPLVYPKHRNPHTCRFPGTFSNTLAAAKELLYPGKHRNPSSPEDLQDWAIAAELGSLVKQNLAICGQLLSRRISIACGRPIFSTTSSALHSAMRVIDPNGRDDARAIIARDSSRLRDSSLSVSSIVRSIWVRINSPNLASLSLARVLILNLPLSRSANKLRTLLVSGIGEGRSFFCK